MTKRTKKPESLCMLILDDEVDNLAIAKQKGYDKIESRYKDIFTRVDRCIAADHTIKDREPGSVMLKKNYYDLLLLDFQLEHYWLGPEVCRILRMHGGRHVKNRGIYIIGASTLWTRGHIEQGLINSFAYSSVGLFQEIDGFLKERHPHLYKKRRVR